jgi:hypothetical protein
MTYNERILKTIFDAVVKTIYLVFIISLEANIIDS